MSFLLFVLLLLPLIGQLIHSVRGKRRAYNQRIIISIKEI